MTRPEKRVYKKKTASNVSFYGGFISGLISSIEGLIMFTRHQALQDLVWESLKPLRNATAGYVSIILLVVFISKEKLTSTTDVMLAFLRWSRLVTVVVSMFLERNLKANAKMFFAALKIRHERFGAALEGFEKPKRTFVEKMRKYKRLAKIISLKLGSNIVAYLVPDFAIYINSVVKFFSVKPVLGAPVACAFASCEVLSKQFFSGGYWDDLFIALCEALVDAEDLTMDGTKQFYIRLGGEEEKRYFRKRYRGYLTGCGFSLSLLMQIPFISIPLTLVAECSAACAVVDIVEKNLHKDNRIAFPCEGLLKQDEGAPADKDDDDTKKEN